MTTCDPVVPGTESTSSTKDKSTTEKAMSSSKSNSELEPKVKQDALLSVVHSHIKGAMIEELSNNISIRAKLRTWFVRAHKDNTYVVLKSLISVLNKLTSLSAKSLAEVKFGKAILIVSRKCEDKEVKGLLSSWLTKAEESLVLEREMDVAAAQNAAIGEETKKTSTNELANSNLTAKSDVKPSSVVAAQQGNGIKKADTKAKDLVSKRAGTTAKTNAAFFKKEILPPVKPVLNKPGMAATLAGIKARKKTEADKVVSENKSSSSPATSATTGPSASTLAKDTDTSKSAFSALKLVEGLKRTVSPNVSKSMEPVTKKVRQKKRVSWRPDLELEQVLVFESIEPEGGWGTAYVPHDYRDARALDRKEGALLHSGILPDPEEDFIDWTTPRGTHAGRLSRQLLLICSRP